MARTFVNDGDTVVLAAGGVVAVGSIAVIGTQIGVALNAAAASGDLVTYAMGGVYRLPAVNGAAFTAGKRASYDISGLAFDDEAMTPATGDVTLACTAWETKTAGASDTVLVKLNTANGTVT